jgi:serine acetyltransferase
MPPTIPVNHYSAPYTNNWSQVLLYYSMLHYSGCACLEHSNFLKVKFLNTRPQVNEDELLRRMWPGRTYCYAQPRHRSSTTSFLTATTLIYATGAGITAAAGTRLALQWVLAKAFALFSFQSRDIAPSCYFLSLPP